MTSLKWKVSCEHVYAIYQAYTWYKYRSIVYIRYIPGIKHAYTFHMTTYSIYLTYTYSKLSATFRYQSRYGLVMEYTWYIPGILHDQTVTWLVPKCRRKFWVGVCQVYTVCRHMKGICMFYTRYIPDIYYWSIFISGVCLVYRIYMFTWNLSLQWCHILGICLVYTIDICGIY